MQWSNRDLIGERQKHNCPIGAAIGPTLTMSTEQQPTFFLRVLLMNWPIQQTEVDFYWDHGSYKQKTNTWAGKELTVKNYHSEACTLAVAVSTASILASMNTSHAHGHTT